ncbi:MAG: LacI family DNA-binding transcriptional regulator [Microbacterium sp.]|nr:LacI family DNA-binding transcriptional regulator [Microbacterium sp.]
MLIDRLTIGELTDLGDPAETSAGGEVPETTIDHVADRAGVSRSTVSRVLSGSSKVDARTRAKVEGAIVSLGYRPSVHARELARTAHRQDSARSPRT